MRWAPVVILLAAIAAGLVHLRREQTHERYRIRRLQLQQVAIRRELWDQQGRLSEATTPQRVRQFVQAHGLDLADRTTSSTVHLSDSSRSRRLSGR
jgi:hypothetical protein